MLVREGIVTFHSLLHYKVDIFSLLTAVLIIYFSASESFLIIELVVRQKFSSPYPLRGKNIFLKNYLSNILVLMRIERFLERRSLSPQIHSLSHYKIDIFSFLKAVLAMHYNTPERFLKSGRVIRLFSSLSIKG